MNRLPLPPDHPERAAVAGEVHARPPEAMPTPSRVTYLALLVEPSARAAEAAHLARLCALAGVAPPAAGASHFSSEIGDLRLKWERHGEFSSYTFHAAGGGDESFADPPIGRLPAGWLQALPGTSVVGANAAVIAAPAGGAAEAELLGRCFGGATIVASAIAGGAAVAGTDFRIHADGCGRFVLLDRALNQRQAGRMLQRLFEIEAYRMLALLALPLARGLTARLSGIESELALDVSGIAGDGQRDDDTILHGLTRLAQEVEGRIVASQFRFGACAAYHALVLSRIDELREERLPGLQTIGEFMGRRLSPAVATVATTSRRLHELAERIAQACTLLATRVGIAREHQSRALLESMNRRARLQLRLQQTVEGLSVVAILYYVGGLVGYGAKALKGAGLVGWQPDVVVGLLLLPIAAGALIGLRRLRKRLGDDG